MKLKVGNSYINANLHIVKIVGYYPSGVRYSDSGYKYVDTQGLPYTEDGKKDYLFPGPLGSDLIEEYKGDKKMKFADVFRIVEGEYNYHHATLVVAALALNLTMKPKQKDLLKPDRFTDRLNKKTHDLLWEEPPDVVDLIIKIRDAWDEYEQRQALKGLGGCESMRLRDIVGRHTAKPPINKE